MTAVPSSAPSKAEEIAGILRTEILRGQYRAGERLPSERDLAARFCANRGAIREAIKKLEQLGVASVTPGGVRILPIEEATLEVLGHLLDLEETSKPQLIAQFLDVLGAMMSLSANTAITEATDDGITELHQIALKLVSAVGIHDQTEQAWQEWGEVLASINQNLVLRLIGNGLRTQFVGRLVNIDMQPEIDLDALRNELESLAQAIVVRDQDKIAQAIIKHFQIIKQGLLNSASAVAQSSLRNSQHG